MSKRKLFHAVMSLGMGSGLVLLYAAVASAWNACPQYSSNWSTAVFCTENGKSGYSYGASSGKVGASAQTGSDYLNCPTGATGDKWIGEGLDTGGNVGCTVATTGTTMESPSACDTNHRWNTRVDQRHVNCGL
jgi:hypothetical protein